MELFQDSKTSLSPENQRTIGMENLPPDIILNILLRLPIMSLLQFKCVSRSWRALAQDINLPTMHFARSRQKNPCLILHHDSPIQNQLFVLDNDAYGRYDNSMRKITMPFRPMMSEFDVVGSCNGFLCLSDSLLCNTICVYNPFTHEYIELPKTSQYAKQEVVVGFGLFPTISEYKVIRLVYYVEQRSRLQRRSIYRQQSEVEIFTLGTNSWKNIGSARYFIHQHSPRLLLTGILHWVILPSRYQQPSSRIIVSFNFATEKFQQVPCPRWDRPGRHTFHLAELQGCLSAVVDCKDGSLEIWVMKEYNVKESWMKEFTIGQYVPAGLNQQLFRPIRIWRNGMTPGSVRVLCALKCGKFLLEYENQALVFYDPIEGNFEELVIQGLPKWFRSVTHVGSLVSLGAEIAIHR